MRVSVVVGAVLLSAFLAPAVALAWHCPPGVPDNADTQASGQCVLVEPTPSPPPVVTVVATVPPVVPAPAATPTSSSISGHTTTVAVCHNEDSSSGVQSVERRNVLPYLVQRYLHSPSGLDFLMTPGGDCGQTTL